MALNLLKFTFLTMHAISIEMAYEKMHENVLYYHDIVHVLQWNLL